MASYCPRYVSAVKEDEVSFHQGQHIWANFPDGEVAAIILEVRGDILVVQQEGTQRAEEIHAERCRKR